MAIWAGILMVYFPKISGKGANEGNASQSPGIGM